MPDLLPHSILCPILIGRDAQLVDLTHLLDQARGGQGQVALISGEAGIGKSRLVAEAKMIAADQGFTVLQGNSFEPDRALPYAPLLDLLRGFCAAEHPGALVTAFQPYPFTLVKLLPELATLVSAPPAAPPLDPEQEQRHLFQSLTRFLTEHHSQLAIDHPQLIILEDLHWCDNASLEFLLVFARQLATRPLLLLLTCRSDESTPALEQFLAQLDRTRLVHELSLSRLPPAGTELMIRTIFAQNQSVRQEFVARIHELTEGNPFFIEETLKSLVATGDIFFTKGGWTRKLLDDLRVPRTVQVAVAQRTAQVSPAARRLLTVAAVAGRRFDFALLQAITGEDETALVDLIKELFQAQLVVEENTERFAFRHALTQQAIYNDLLRRERRPLHRTVAESIEALYADNLEARLADLSLHFYRAEVWSKTLAYARRAGERARALHAPQAAVEHFTRAIGAAQNLSPAPAPEARLLLQARGQAYEQLGEFKAARDDYEATLVTARSGDDQRACWQALMDLGFLWAQRDYVQAGDYFQEALAAARNMDDPALLAHTLKRLGNWHMNLDQLDEAVQLLNEALQLFETLNDRRGLAETLDLLGIAHYASANALAGSHFYRRAIDLFRHLDDPGGELNSLCVYAPRHCVYINNAAVWPRVSLAERLRDGEAAVALARKLGARPAEALALIWPGNTLAIAGAYEQALTQVQQGLALAEEIGHRHFIATAQMVLGAIYWDLLLLAEAQTHLAAALQLARDSNSLTWLGGITAYLASTLLQQGDRTGAERTLQQAWRADLPMRSQSQRQLWSVRAELALAQRQPGEALAILERLIAADPHTPTQGVHAIPRLAHLRGDALAALGRFAEAEETLRTAQSFAVDSPGLLWRLQLALGHCYRRRNRRDDADRAFAAARTTLTQIGDKLNNADRRQRFLAQAYSQFPHPTSLQAAKQTAAGLTAKERQVAALIAQGKSNKEIAQVLVVSHRTVETHVSNILAKLYLSSRAQIAVWAAEQGLTP
jgi:DNA-binding CsgD family transcriptional regulator/Flp pilus assembly protein TadD